MQGATSAPPEIDHRAILGATNAHLIIDRLSAGAETLLGSASDDLLGQSLLELVNRADVLALVRAAARCIETDDRASISVSVQRKEGTVRCNLSLVSMRPAPSLMFALTEDSAGVSQQGARHVDTNGEEPRAESVGQQSICRVDIPGLTRLSAREVEIVGRLFNGDRVPAIACGLFVSQSTVRNHLSAVYRKLGVRSQQELIHALREALPTSNATLRGGAVNRVARSHFPDQRLATREQVAATRSPAAPRET